MFCLEKLEAIIPEGSWDEAQKNLRSQFMLGLLDGDLLHMLETCVPESDAISCVGPVRHGEVHVICLICLASFFKSFVNNFPMFAGFGPATREGPH